jgi:glutamate-5-semialdehyde dehydrogenase
MNEVFAAVRKASRSLPLLEAAVLDEVLTDLAGEAVREIDFLIAENRKDLARMDPADPKYDRLMLTPDRIRAIAGDIRNVAQLDYPVGKTFMSRTLPNGLSCLK